MYTTMAFCFLVSLQWALYGMIYVTNGLSINSKASFEFLLRTCI